jgi:hypothetical protein
MLAEPLSVPITVALIFCKKAGTSAATVRLLGWLRQAIVNLVASSTRLGLDSSVIRHSFNVAVSEVRILGKRQLETSEAHL